MKKAKWTWTAHGQLVEAADTLNPSRLATGPSPSLQSDAPKQPTTAPENQEKPDMSADVMLTTKQTSVILGKSTETLKKWRQRRIGPAYIRNESRAIGYPMSVVKQYLDDRTVKPSSKKRVRKP